MPRYSESSRQKLETCHPDIQAVFNEVIKHYDCKVLCGHRGQEEQDKAFREGRSKVQWPDGQHNKLPSEAVDVVPYPIDWNNIRRFDVFAGFVLGVAAMMGIQLRWGGDWDRDTDLGDQKFNDLPHFELVR